MLYNKKKSEENQKLGIEPKAPGCIEDCEGWWLSGCCSSVVEHWQFNSGVLVWFLLTAGFFPFLCFTSYIKNASISNWDKTVLSRYNIGSSNQRTSHPPGFSSGKNVFVFSWETWLWLCSNFLPLFAPCLFFHEKGLALVCPVNKTVSGRNASRLVMSGLLN